MNRDLPDRATKPTEIEITPAMIEAGADFFAAHYFEIIEPAESGLSKRIVAGILRAALLSPEEPHRAMHKT